MPVNVTGHWLVGIGLVFGNPPVPRIYRRIDLCVSRFSFLVSRFSLTRGTLAALALLGLAALPQAVQAQVTLFDNGTLVTGVGNGFGGANTSAVFQPAHTFLGAGLNNAASARAAEDFTVSGGSWDLTSMSWFGYQTGSTTTSTFTGAFVTIFDGVPGAGGTNVVAGDFTTNRLTSSAFSNIFRVNNTTLTDSTRPIMELVVDMTWVPDLVPGTYWVAVGATGSLGSGPFLPLRAVTDGASNLMQFSGGTWSPFDVDNVTGGTQTTEAAFQIRGNLLSSSAPEPGTLALLALGIVGGVVARRRK